MLPSIPSLIARAKTWGWGITVAAAILTTGGSLAYAGIVQNKMAPKSLVYEIKEVIHEHEVESAGLAHQVTALSRSVDELADEVRMLRALLIDRLDRVQVRPEGGDGAGGCESSGSAESEEGEYRIRRVDRPGK